MLRRHHVVLRFTFLLALGLFLVSAISTAAAEIQLTGRAVTPEGKPIANAEVVLVPRLPDYAQSRVNLDGRLDPDPVASAKTGRDGSYTLKAPEAGMWALEVRSKGRASQRLRLEPLSGPAIFPDAVMPSGAPVMARILDPDGTALEGVMVYAASVPGEASQQRAWRSAAQLSISDADGQAHFLLPDGDSLRLRAAMPGYLESEIAEVKSGGPNVSITLPRGKAQILEVRDARNTKLADVVVHLGEWGFPVGLTDAEGRFDAVVPLEGEILVELTAPDGREVHERIAAPKAEEGKTETASAPRVLTVPDSVELSGRVLDASRREGLSNAIVWLHGNAGTAVRSDSRGGYTVRFPANGAGENGQRFLRSIANGYFETFARLDGQPNDGPTLTLEPAVQLAGEIVDLDGQPVAGATVLPRDLSDRSVRRRRQRLPNATSGTDGRFLLRRLEPNKTYALIAGAEGFAAQQTVVTSPEAGAAGEKVRIVLDRGWLGVGSVLDLDQQPVAGAEATLTPSSEAGSANFRGAPPAAQTVSNAAGEIEMPNLPSGRFDLRVEAPGYAPLTVPGIEIGANGATADGTFDLGAVLLEPGTVLAGMVSDTDGQPIPSAEVRIADSQNEWRLFNPSEKIDATSAADGRFQILDLRPGQILTLHVHAAGYAPAQIKGAVAGEDEIEVALQRAMQISGRVVDERGSAIAGARIEPWMEHNYGSLLPIRSARARSDEEGRFTVAGLTHGKVRLDVRADGFEGIQKEILLDADRDAGIAGEDLENLEIVLRPGATVMGQVLSASGEPVTQAWVTLQPNPGERNAMTQSSSRTDGEGRYRLEGVPPGSREVVARDGRREARQRVQVEPGENLLDLRFEGGVEVSGWITSADGQPLAGADVVLSQREGRWVEIGARSIADGSFSLADVEPGRYQIRASKAGFATTSMKEPLEVGEQDERGVELQLHRGGAIVGKLGGASFEELELVRVTAYKELVQGISGQIRHDGTYRISPIEPGTWTVMAKIDDARNARGEVTLGEGQDEARLDLDFGAGLTLSGQVLRDGEPQAGLQLHVTGASYGNATTDHRGRFRIGGLEPGTHRLNVGGFRGAVQHSQEIELSGDLELTVEMRISRLLGRAFDAADGRPLAGVEITLAGMDNPGSFGIRPVATSNADGSFEIELAEGSYQLTGRLEGYAPLTRQAEVSASVQQVEMPLEASPGLRLEVLLANGTRANAIQAALVGPDGLMPVTHGSYSADASGMILISDAPTGSWELVVSDGSASASVQVAVPGPPVAVSLPPAGRLRVRATRQSGHEAAMLQIFGPDGRPYRGLVAEGGLRDRWMVWQGYLRGAHGQDWVSLPAGVWRLVLNYGETQHEATTTVTAGGLSEIVFE